MYASGHGHKKRKVQLDLPAHQGGKTFRPKASCLTILHQNVITRPIFRHLWHKKGFKLCVHSCMYIYINKTMISSLYDTRLKSKYMNRRQIEIRWSKSRTLRTKPKGFMFRCITYSHQTGPCSVTCSIYQIPMCFMSTMADKGDDYHDYLPLEPIVAVSLRIIVFSQMCCHTYLNQTHHVTSHSIAMAPIQNKVE